MPEITKPTAGGTGGAAPADVAAPWPARAYNWIDNQVHHWCRGIAQRWPERALPFVLIAVGAGLIALVSQPAIIVLRLMHGIDCAAPAIGAWFLLDCARAPAAKAVPALVLGFVILVAITWLLGRLFVSFSSRIVLSRLDRVERRDMPCKVLIMGLSPLPPAATTADAIKEAAEWADRAQLYAGPAAPWRERAGNQFPARAGGWQQAARMVALHHCAGALRKIYVLPSAETRGLLPDFQRYLETLFNAKLDIAPVRAEDGQEFEDLAAPEGRQRRSYDNYAYLRDGLRRAIAMAEGDVPRLREDDICIDATAGFKLLSIAAAVVTLDRNILLGYVVSGGADNPEEGVVKLYDPRIEFLGAARNQLAQSAVR